MKTILAVVFALAVSLVGVSGVAPAWAGGGRPSVFPRPVDPWRNWGHSGHGHHAGKFHGGGHFRGQHGQFKGHHGHFKGHHGHRVVVPGGPRAVPGYFVWNGYAWVWVPAY
ncbi:MAG: hypothetical protein ACREM3_22340 [Candidatus Rokuibacteriota bacterium]